MEAIIYVGSSVSESDILKVIREVSGFHYPIHAEIVRFPKPTVLVEEPKKMKQRGLELLNKKR